MNKIFLIIPFVLISCSKENSNHNKPVISDSIVYSDMISKAEYFLSKTEGLEDEIEQTYKTKEVLIKENKTLKKELGNTKDSLQKINKELIETKSKLPKKQNLIQKLFNIKADSVEVIKIDTIK